MMRFTPGKPAASRLAPGHLTGPRAGLWRSREGSLGRARPLSPRRCLTCASPRLSPSGVLTLKKHLRLQSPRPPSKLHQPHPRHPPKSLQNLRSACSLPRKNQVTKGPEPLGRRGSSPTAEPWGHSQQLLWGPSWRGAPTPGDCCWSSLGHPQPLGVSARGALSYEVKTKDAGIRWFILCLLCRSLEVASEERVHLTLGAFQPTPRVGFVWDSGVLEFSDAVLDSNVWLLKSTGSGHPSGLPF